MDRPSDQRFLAGVRRLILERYASDQYKFTALWGGQQGSLLFWTWLLSIFTSIAHSRIAGAIPKSRPRPLRAGWSRDLLSRDAEFRHAPVRSAGDGAARRLRPQSAAAELLDGDPSAVALHRLRQRDGAVRVRLRPRSSRASSTTDGFAPRAAGRSSRGSFSRSAICSARAGPTRFWDGAATGRGTRSRTPPSCRGW